MKQIDIFFVPPSKRGNLARLVGELTNDSEIFDIEAILKKKLDKENMHLVLSSFTREFVQMQWKDAVSEIINAIDKSDKNHFYLFSHAVYFASFRRDYYSGVDVNFLKTVLKSKGLPSISNIVVIVDDIIDTYNSLKGENELFGESTKAQFLQSFKKNLGIENNELGYRAHMNWVHQCVTSLLNWRAQEILLAENFADQLNDSESNCKFILWGLKQNFLTLLMYLTSKKKKIFYLSHAISQPRRHFIDNGEWVELVSTVNKIQQKLLSNSICCILPTAIDEYRFEKVEQNYTSKLNERWPVPDDVGKLLLDFKLIDKDVNQKTSFEIKNISYDGVSVKTSEINLDHTNQQYVNGVLSSIEMNLVEQLAHRDHTLVWSTDGILVLEPMGEDLILHGGVRKELNFLREINKRAQKTAAHSKSNPILKKLIIIMSSAIAGKLVNSADFKLRVKTEVANMISDRVEGVNSADAADIIENNLTLRGISPTGGMGEIIEPSVINSQIKPLFDGFLKNTLCKTFLLSVATLDENDAPLTVFFVEKIEDVLKESYQEKIVKMFEKCSKDEEWKKILISFLN